MSYTSKAELNTPDVFGNIALINPFEGVEDTTDNRGSNLMSEAIDWVAALARGQLSVDVLEGPSGEATLTWDYSTRVLTISGADLSVEMIWHDPNSLTVAATRVVMQVGAHLLGSNIWFFLAPSPGATRTIAPSAVDLATDNAFITGATSGPSLVAGLDALGNPDNVGSTYTSAQDAAGRVVLAKVSGRALSLFGGKIRIRNGYAWKAADRDTQYVQTQDTTISITASAAMTLTGGTNSSMTFGDSASIDLGDGSSLTVGDEFELLTDGDMLLQVGGALTLTTGSANSRMRFNTSMEAGIWSTGAFVASLEMTSTKTILEETRAGGLQLRASNGAMSGPGLDIDVISGGADLDISAGGWDLRVAGGDNADFSVLDGGRFSVSTTTGDISLGSASGDLDILVATLQAVFSGGASSLEAQGGLDIFVSDNSATFGIYTEGTDSPLELRADAAWASSTHPGSWVKLESPGGISLGRVANTHMSTLAQTNTVLVADAGYASPGNGQLGATTLGLLNTVASDVSGQRASELLWQGFNSTDAAGVPHHQGKIRMEGALSTTSRASAMSFWLNTDAGATSLTKRVHLGGTPSSEAQLSVLGVPFVVDEDEAFESIPPFTMGSPISDTVYPQIAARAEGSAWLSAINTERVDDVDARLAGVLLGGYRANDDFVPQAAISAQGQGVSDAAVMRFWIADGSQSMVQFAQKTSVGAFEIFSELYALFGLTADDVTLTDVTITDQAVLDGGAVCDGDVVVNAGSYVNAPNTIWAAATIHVNNGSMAVAAAGAHSPLKTNGLVRTSRVDSVLNITATDHFEIHLSEALPASGDAVIWANVSKNDATSHDELEAHIISNTATTITFKVVDNLNSAVGTSALTGGDVYITVLAIAGE